MEDKRRGSEISSKVWIKIAKKELERAFLSLKNNDYPDSVFHSQQAVEKAVKSLLESYGIIVREHYVSRHLDKIKENLEEIKEIVIWFEKDKKWEFARYPIEKGGKIVLPEDIFTKEIAKEALKKAKFVFNKISKILERRGIKL